MTEYVALRGLQAPGTSVFGYQRGDLVGESVVEAWGLVLGDDVAEGTEVPEPAPAIPATRPGAADTRATWEAWAVANGMTPEDAENASQDDLESYEPVQQGGRPQRPADSAPKADWVAYAIAQGADERWAKDSATTKANLQAYEPAPGDTIATAATEANSGS